MTDQLKPCPFCGGEESVSVMRNGLNLWWVSCCECPVWMEQSGGGYFTEEEAAAAWNTRHIPEGCALVSTRQLELCVAHLKTQSPVNGNTVLVIENMIKAAQGE